MFRSASIGSARMGAPCWRDDWRRLLARGRRAGLTQPTVWWRTWSAGNGNEPPDAAELRRHLSERLPRFMVPSRFIAVDAFPLLPNGKVDREALVQRKAPSDTGAAAAHAANHVEAQLMRIWDDLIDVPEIGPSRQLLRARRALTAPAAPHRSRAAGLRRHAAAWSGVPDTDIERSRRAHSGRQPDAFVAVARRHSRERATAAAVHGPRPRRRDRILLQPGRISRSAAADLRSSGAGRAVRRDRSHGLALSRRRSAATSRMGRICWAATASAAASRSRWPSNSSPQVKP